MSDSLAKPFHSRVSTSPGLSLHKDMYILFGSYSNEYYNRQTETVFQISAKQNLFNSGVYLGYTQKSFWQAYDYKNSSPFRETNFNPEIFYRVLPGTYFHESLGADLGFEHESNGQNAPESRSWNRLYLAPYYQEGNTIIYSKCWYRLPESDKPFQGASEGDDNPDITDYMGYGELHLYQKLFDIHTIHAMARGNITHHRGALALNYCLKIPSIKASFILSFFTGYGESLIDYNRSITRVGAGFYFNG
ncbi:MAG: phospholipase A [Proteobacteria bacterium]|nr:phospholipase A [Pseudomonadota bacterium]